MIGKGKQEVYQRAAAELEALLEGLDDDIAVMASAASILHRAIPAASWTGFYRVVEKDLLRVGPYQGPVGCLEIPFSRGVCGAAARLEETQIVADVHQFAGHIACDPAARSEIVVPIHGRDGELKAVLDIDSHQPSAFDEVDRQELESISKLLRHFL